MMCGNEISDTDLYQEVAVIHWCAAFPGYSQNKVIHFTQPSASYPHACCTLLSHCVKIQIASFLKAKIRRENEYLKLETHICILLENISLPEYILNGTKVHTVHIRDCISLGTLCLHL